MIFFLGKRWDLYLLGLFPAVIPLFFGHIRIMPVRYIFLVIFAIHFSCISPIWSGSRATEDWIPASEKLGWRHGAALRSNHASSNRKRRSVIFPTLRRSSLDLLCPVFAIFSSTFVTNHRDSYNFAEISNSTTIFLEHLHFSFVFIIHCSVDFFNPPETGI